MPADTDGTLARFERPLRYVMGFAYVVAGVLHFVAPAAYERVVPPELPRPRLLVYLSGVAEVVLGVGVMFERTRRPAANGIVALLVAVFPANVHMAARDVDIERVDDVPDAALWARLPLQGVLALWARWHARPAEPDD